MYEEMLEAFDKDKDFRRYVKDCMRTYGKTKEYVLQMRITEQYYLSLQKGGCNERRMK